MTSATTSRNRIAASERVRRGKENDDDDDDDDYDDNSEGRGSAAAAADERPPWRRQYDEGGAPWTMGRTDEDEDGDDCNGDDVVVFRHFGIAVRRNAVERSCRDDGCGAAAEEEERWSSVHRHRLSYVERVPISKVIKETYREVRHWHPVTENVDNFKWAKLARRMRFLSSSPSPSTTSSSSSVIRNPTHEVDMAFLRHSSKIRRLDLDGFEAVLRDIASVRYPGLDAEEALHRLLWATVIMLPRVNAMVWNEAKRMTMSAEAVRMCAQMRLAASFRRNQRRAAYVVTVRAATCVARYARRAMAMRRRRYIMSIVAADYIFRLRVQCATICQTAWRGFRCRTSFSRRVARMRELERIKLDEDRRKFKARRMKIEGTTLFRRAVRIQGITVIVTMMLLNDGPRRTMIDQVSGCGGGSGSSLGMNVYERVTQRTFDFILEEAVLRECVQAALGDGGPLSWNDMLDATSLSLLTDRLMVRFVNGLPSVLFSRRNLVERGALISKKPTRIDRILYVLYVYRSPSEFVLCTYEPASCGRLRTMISSQDLASWLRKDERLLQRRRRGMPFSEEAGDGATGSCGPALMQPERQDMLVAWLGKRLVVERDQITGGPKLLLQCVADEAKKEDVAIKVQSIVRRLVAKRRAQEEARRQFEKVFDREHGVLCYVNTYSGFRQWDKPKLLGEEDLADPPDEWRRIEQENAQTGAMDVYYHNPATGQTSWLTEQDAARMVQRRFRHRQAADIDIVGSSKLDFAAVALALKFVRDTEISFERNPGKLSHRVNYALLCHCIRFDTNQARLLYKDAMQKSPCHPVITRSYGIFILASCDSPRLQMFERASTLFKEADARDPNAQMFQSAMENCFRWAVLAYPSNPIALLNYALLHQCVLGDYNRAEKIYRRALAADPTNPLVSQNFSLFAEQRYPGGVYYAGCGPPVSIVRRSSVIDEKPEWGEWKRMVDPMCPRKGFEMFWYNKLKQITRFDEPDWKGVWRERVQRSTPVNAVAKQQWVQYYDESLGTTFFYSRLTDEFICHA